MRPSQGGEGERASIGVAGGGDGTLFFCSSLNSIEFETSEEEAKRHRQAPPQAPSGAALWSLFCSQRLPRDGCRTVSEERVARRVCMLAEKSVGKGVEFEVCQECDCSCSSSTLLRPRASSRLQRTRTRCRPSASSSRSP